MKTVKNGLITSTLISAVLLASPLAMADHHGDRDGKRHHRDICEKIDSSEWQEKREEMRAKFDDRHEEIADRLELTDEQRVTWDEIQEERRQKYQERMDDIQERCEQRNDS